MPFTAKRPLNWAVPLVGILLGAAAALALVGGADSGQGVSALWGLVGQRAALAEDLVPAEDPAATSTYDWTTALPPCEPSQSRQSGQPGQAGESVTVTSEGQPGQPGQSSSQVSQSTSQSASTSSSSQSQSSSSSPSQSSGASGTTTASDPSALRATFRLCGTADAQAARAIEQLVAGRGFTARLVSVRDGCADLTIDVSAAAAALTSGRSISNLSVAAGSQGNGAGRRVAVEIVSENGQTRASITG